MPMDYQGFSVLYGKDIIEKQSQPVSLASTEQVALAKSLVDTLNVSKETIEAYFEKAKVDRWEEMLSETIQKIIDHFSKKIAEAAKPAGNGNPYKDAPRHGIPVGRK